jgi:hypothetical protein
VVQNFPGFARYSATRLELTPYKGGSCAVHATFDTDTAAAEALRNRMLTGEPVTIVTAPSDCRFAAAAQLIDCVAAR